MGSGCRYLLGGIESLDLGLTEAVLQTAPRPKQMTHLCTVLVSQLPGGGGAEGALETAAEITLVGAPWGARQGLNRPRPDWANADQGKQHRDLSQKAVVTHLLSTYQEPKMLLTHS